MKPTLIVTGGAGFIGRNLIEALNWRGHTRIILVDDLGTGPKWTNLQGLIFEDVWSIAELRRRIASEAMPETATVFHLGACSATDEANADYLLDNNTRMTRDLCEWSVSHGTRFIYASSAATYGAGEHGYNDEDSETTLLKPLNMYGYSKHLFDLWALRSGRLNEIAGLKYFNVYGPGEAHKGPMRSVVNKALAQIESEGRVQLFKSYRPDYADGEQKRDFVYVRDAVEQTLFFHDHHEANGLFNCGTGTARSWKDLAKAVFQALGKPVTIEFIDMPPAIRSHYQYFTEAMMGKVRRAGYSRPPTSLEDGVAAYAQALAPVPVAP